MTEEPFLARIKTLAAGWDYGLDSAIKRLAEAHLCEAPEMGMDARDRQALAVLVLHAYGCATEATAAEFVRI